MALKHSVYDTDTHFSINPETRALVNESSGKNTMIQYDHNSERITFEIPRYIEGHDMSMCDVVQVHYNNINSSTKEQSCGVYAVEDMQISPEDESIVILSWLISGNATKYVGSLNFLIRFACSKEDGTLYYVWNTGIYSGISISTGIYNGEVVAEEYADILAQWERDIYNIKTVTSNFWRMDDILPFSNDVLQDTHTFYYYSTMKAAVADVNAGTVGKNADAKKDTAAVGAYITPDNKVVVVLLQDITSTETILINSDVILKLGGKVLSFVSGTQLEFTSTVTNAVIDGRISGSKIQKISTEENSNTERLIILSCNNINIIGGEYSITVKSTVPSCTLYINDGVNITTKDCVFKCADTGTKGRVIGAQNKGVLVLDNCLIECENRGIKLEGISNTAIGELLVKNSKINVKSNGIYETIGFHNQGICKVEYVDVFAELVNSTTVVGTGKNSLWGISNTSNATIEILDGKVRTKSKELIKSNGMVNAGHCTIHYIDIYADALCGGYTGSNGTYSVSEGLGMNGKTFVMYDGKVFGTAAGLSVQTAISPVLIKGGEFSGVGHGGMYFYNKDTPNYIENAKIINAKYNGEYKDSFVYDEQYHISACYIGGNSNISIYADNCEFVGGLGSPVRMRGSAGEQNNSLYASNCTFTGNDRVDVDNTTHKLYLGKHNNITADDTSSPSSVVLTDEIYIG